MKIKLSQEQLEWLCKVTDKTDAQQAVDVFIELMRQESIDAAQILIYVNRMMRKPWPPK